MTRKELENRINDAADGQLSSAELVILEQELELYPDLLHDYREIMALPDLSGIYGSAEDYRDPAQVRTIREQLIEHEPFTMASIFWFRKVALAASLLILGVSSLAGYLTGALSESAYTEAISADDMIYPQDDSFADEYVSYIYEWPASGDIDNDDDNEGEGAEVETMNNGTQ